MMFSYGTKTSSARQTRVAELYRTRAFHARITDEATVWIVRDKMRRVCDRSRANEQQRLFTENEVFLAIPANGASMLQPVFVRYMPERWNNLKPLREPA